MTCERNLDLALNKQESKNARVLLWIRTFVHAVLGHLTVNICGS
jgi:hypothetical protein